MDAHDNVLSRLREVVLSAGQADGQLPTERELCRSLGISRTALREHLQALEVVGLLRRDQGRGTFLQSPDGTALGSVLDLAMLADGVPPDDLMYVRRILERESAALATGRIDPVTHARLLVLCAKMRDRLPAQDIADADHEFHMLLLKSSGNAALRLLAATLSQALHRSMREMREFIATERRAQLDMARAHERVLHAVLGGDPQQSWHEMDHHFSLNEKIVKRIQVRGIADRSGRPKSDGSESDLVDAQFVRVAATIESASGS